MISVRKGVRDGGAKSTAHGRGKGSGREGKYTDRLVWLRDGIYREEPEQFVLLDASTYAKNMQAIIDRRGEIISVPPKCFKYVRQYVYQ